jgi:hypothetical protein
MGYRPWGAGYALARILVSVMLRGSAREQVTNLIRAAREAWVATRVTCSKLRM